MTEGAGEDGRFPNGKHRGYRRHPVCHPGGGGGPGGRGRHHPGCSETWSWTPPGLVNGQGALTLSKDLTLDGSGHTIRAKAGTFSVSGDNGTGPSLLNLQDGAEVTLRDVTLDGGSAAKHGLNMSPRRNGDPGERGDLQLPLVRPGGQWHGAVRGRPDHLRKPVGRQHRPGQPRHLCERCYCRGGFHCL